MIIKNKEDFCKKLGYKNISPCIQKINFLEKYGIEEYLKQNFKYDFVLGSELLLKKIIESFGSEKDKNDYETIKEKLNRKSGHLFVNTSFKRISQPIFAMAFMESLRNILIDRKNFNSPDEELEYVKNFVKNHYQKNNGQLNFWGKIKNYHYKSDWMDVVLDKNGGIINQNCSFQKAKLMIKNKEIKL